MSLGTEPSSPYFISDDAESVKRVRRLVVALAISGRLSASAEAGVDGQAIASRIDEAKQRLVSQGLLRRADATSIILATELPDALPNSASYVSLGSVARIEKGLTGIQKAAPGPYPLVVTAKDRAACDHFDFDGAAAIVPLVSSAGHGKASLQRLHYQEGKFALGSILAAIFPLAPELVSARFLYEYLTAFKDELLVSRMIGTANVSLSIGKVSEVPVPLLTPAVQRRVDELMALCDQLEAARAEREAARDRLAAAALARLNAPDSETFVDDATFALNVLPALTARADQIQQIRQTILGLAMSGKLVSQDVRDEPAAAVLGRGGRLPDGYQRRRKILKESSVAPPNELFPLIPETWSYTDIQTLYDLNAVIDYADGNHGARYPRSSEFGEDGVTFVTAKDLAEGRVVWASCAKLHDDRAKQLPKGWSLGGDVLLTHNATVGRVARVESGVGPFLLGTSVTFYRLNPSIIDPDFFYYMLRSALWQGQLEAIMAQTTRNQVSIQKQASFRVVVPPIAEQRRIATLLDELMALCDQLEDNLSAGADRGARLLEALHYRAVEPAREVESIGRRTGYGLVQVRTGKRT